MDNKQILAFGFLGMLAGAGLALIWLQRDENKFWEDQAALLEAPEDVESPD